MILMFLMIIGCQKQPTQQNSDKFIEILKPNRGEVYRVGDTLEISWNAGGTNLFTIYISYNSGINYTEIANNYYSAEFRFKFKPEQSSDSCIIRIEDAENPNLFDVSDSLFSIRAARSVEILYPNGGEIYIVGDSLALSWKAVEVDTFNIYMSYDGGVSYSEIIKNYNSEDFRFKYKLLQYSNKCIIKIEDASDKNIFDISNAYFSIAVEFFPLDNIRSWTYRYTEYLTIAMWSVFRISGTKNWEYISTAQNLDSTIYLFKEVFNYQRIDNPWQPYADTTYHIETAYFSIIDYKTSLDSIRFIPPFYASIQSYYIQYNLPLNRYYLTASDTIKLNYCCPSYKFTLEKGVGIKYLSLYGVEGGHSSNYKIWELINYQLK